MPPRLKLSPADALTLIADRAESLRRAGVLSIQIDNISFQLAPYTDTPAMPTGQIVERTTYSDPLSDPATYQGGRVPGFELLDEEETS